jgi:hypothetical protein
MNLPSLRMRDALIATILFGIGGLLLLPRDAPPSASPAPPEVSLVSHLSSPSHEGVDFIPIKSIRVGQRVWVAEDAPGDGDLEFGEDVIAAQWRKMVLRCPKRDGSTAHVEMLRPVWWLAERDVAAGGTVEIDVPECGISGRADVLAVEACPPIASGPGRVVTSTFHHQAAATIDIAIEGMEEPIGSTPNHPIWSETEQQFVRADALRPGEQVRTLTGLAQVVAITPRGPPEPVFNLEVQVDHLFHVGTGGVLVHNNLPLVNSCYIPPNEVKLTFRPDWDEAQRAAAIAKAKALTEAQTKVVKNPLRKGTEQAKFRAENGLGPDQDADHIIDLQVNGQDIAENLQGLDKSVNRSLGSQIQNAIRDLAEGTPIGRFYFE